MSEYKGFFGALFDLSFSEFVTTKLIKLIFMIAIACSALCALFIIIYGFGFGGGTIAFLSLILAPVVFFVNVLLSRIWLELIIVVFRIAENTSEIARAGRTTPTM
jgi:hypothetical protein